MVCACMIVSDVTGLLSGVVACYLDQGRPELPNRHAQPPPLSSEHRSLPNITLTNIDRAMMNPGTSRYLPVDISGNNAIRWPSGTLSST
jgi:hypothetical protein